MPRQNQASHQNSEISRDDRGRNLAFAQICQTLVVVTITALAIQFWAFGYAYFLLHTHVIIFVVAGWLIAGVGLACLTHLLLRLSAHDHPAFKGTLAAFLGVVGVYSTWLWYFWIASRHEILALDPKVLFDQIAASAASRPWTTFGGAEPNQIECYVIWSIEAAGLLLPMIFFASQDKALRCSNCNEALQRKGAICLYNRENYKIRALRSELYNQQFAQLTETDNLPNFSERTLVADLHFCLDCPDEVDYLTLTVASVDPETGECQPDKRRLLVEHLAISGEVTEQLRNRGEAFKQQLSRRDQERWADFESA